MTTGPTITAASRDAQGTPAPSAPGRARGGRTGAPECLPASHRGDASARWHRPPQHRKNRSPLRPVQCDAGRRGVREGAQHPMSSTDHANAVDAHELRDHTGIRITDPSHVDDLAVVDLRIGLEEPVVLQVVADTPADVADALRELARQIDSKIARRALELGQ